METTELIAPEQAHLTQASAAACPVCHLQVAPEYYFCPNCGAEVRPAPLSLAPSTQTLMYLHSLILPSLLFISITRWKGYKYFKSPDKKAQQVGLIAVVLLLFSTIFTFGFAYKWTMDTVQASIDSVNADLNF